MKFLSVLSFAAVAAAFILPDAQVFEELALEAGHDEHRDPIIPLSDDDDDDGLGSYNIEDGSEFDSYDIMVDRPRHGRRRSNLTIYELINKSNHTTKFAKLVDKYESIVKLLNSTKANYTLFVPIDEAFEHVPKHHKKFGEEFIENLLSYHIGLGQRPAYSLLSTHTIPTALNETWLGGLPQRLRSRVGLRGAKINFYSKLVAADILAANGVIHAVSRILVPPPMVGRELTLFPSAFSTLLLAYDKTDFVSFIHGLKTNGTTVFAPTNAAFAALGPKANAFLFNTEIGLKFLRALLKYQIAANATLYSDAYYHGNSLANQYGQFRMDLPTLLGDKSITVNFAHFGGIIRMRVNGRVPVVVQDGIAKNGVIHVVGRVPIPPRKHRKETDEDIGEISVEDLKDRLAEFVEEDTDKYEVGDL
jgi:uncharacterized surface protein with fasciclin (FAS1) repeats